jgi:D-alanyl-D-alanine carboxypeptidase
VDCPDPLRRLLAELGIPLEEMAARCLVLHDEAPELVLAETAPDGRKHMLAPAAAQAWQDMKAAALADRVPLRIVSAFRSVERQAEIVRRKLGEGTSIAEILRQSAPPGFSEHHTGCAIDIGTDDSPVLEREFEQTPAFAWLCANAGRFGFSMSFPADNPYGYVYEPWHWCHGSRRA